MGLDCSNYWFYEFAGEENKKYQRLFLLHAETKEFKENVEEAKLLIEDAFKKYPKWYLAYSGGKDSTAVMGLLWEMGLNKEVELFNICDDRAFSFHISYIKMIAEKYEFKLDLRYLGNTTDLDFRLDESSSKQLPELAKKIDEIRDEKNKNAGAFMGLRAQESKKRKFLWSKTLGVAEMKKNGMWYCNPIMRWSCNDVFAFLLTRKIPIVDVYRRTHLWGGPCKIRYHDATPRNFASEGQAIWLRHHYPEEFFRLAKKHPEIMNY